MDVASGFQAETSAPAGAGAHVVGGIVVVQIAVTHVRGGESAQGEVLGDVAIANAKISVQQTAGDDVVLQSLVLVGVLAAAHHAAQENAALAEVVVKRVDEAQVAVAGAATAGVVTPDHGAVALFGDGLLDWLLAWGDRGPGVQGACDAEGKDGEDAFHGWLGSINAPGVGFLLS